jgi:hypothetical protein
MSQATPPEAIGVEKSPGEGSDTRMLFVALLYRPQLHPPI